MSTSDAADLSEQLGVLASWNDTAAPLETRTVVDYFVDQVQVRPDDIAVVDGDRRLSYGDLGRRAHQLARHLLDAGIEDEGVVAIGLDRSAEMIVAILATSIAGGAFVPLDPSWPADRRESVLGDSGALLEIRSAAASANEIVPVVPVSLDDWAYSTYSGDSIGTAIQGTRLAYVIFTSGSTGRPKGAMIRHEAIASRMRWQVEEILGFGPGDASMFKAPLSFDISVNEILLPLVSGGRVVIARPGGERDPQYLLDLIASERVSFVYLVSSMLDVLLELASGTDFLAGLKHVWCGGEVLTPELFDRFRSQLATTLYHGYGPAEATIGVSHVIYRDGADRIATSIGKPNPNTQLYVLDDDLRPVPVGVGGELYAAGFLLGRGYVNAPSLTAGRFMANPFGAPGSRLYRTGDLARWAPDGSLDFLGRADNQVKIRGMRLELEDVENGLASHPEVRQSCVTVGETAGGSKFLAGYVVAHAAARAALAPEDVRVWATSKLPEYMVPATIMILDEFPLTPNGKLDRRALPEPVFESSSRQGPSTETERALCTLYSEVLGHGDIGADDDFFAMGGDSIVAISLVSKARRAGLALGPGDVFRLRTPAALARLVDAADVVRTDCHDVAAGAVPGTPIVRWIGEVGGAVDGFVQSVVLAVPPSLTYARASEMLFALMSRHDLLRATLVRGHEWSFDIPDVVTVPTDRLLRGVDVRGVDDDELARRLETEIPCAVSGLDPDRGVMIQAVLFDAGDTVDGRLLLTVHHLVIDGVSWRIVFDDLADAWASIAAGEPIAMPEASTSFRRWAGRLSASTADGAFDASLEHWATATERADRLLGRRALHPATDVVANERTRTVTVPASITAPLLTTVPAAFGGGVNDVLLTALAVTLARWRRQSGTAQDCSIVELEGHGREDEAVSNSELPDADLSRTVGWFTTLFPVALDPGSPRAGESATDPAYWARALKAIKEALRRVPDKGLSWGALRYLGSEDVRSRLSAASTPQVLFNYLGRFDAPRGQWWQPAADVGTLGEARDPSMVLPRALEVNAVTSDSVDGPVLSATFSWPDGVFTDADVDALTAHWTAGLEALSTIAEFGGRTPSDFPLVTVSQDEVDAVDAVDGVDLIDILPLTPMQEGLYFHSTFDEASRSSYVEQQIITFAGSIDVERLHRAADELMRRHPNLAAGFVAADDGHPISVLRGSAAAVGWAEVDDVRPEDVSRLAADDRARGFDLTAPPLMRYLVLHLADSTIVVQTVHHIVADGWSVPLMVRDLAELYTDSTRPLQPARPYRDYVRWLRDLDTVAAENAWRTALDGVDSGTSVLAAASGRESDLEATVTRHADASTTLSRTESDAVLSAARDRGLTLAAMVHGAWGLLVGKLLGRTDVVFGSTVSGRTGDLDGLDTMVGLIVDTIAVRMTWSESDTGARALGRHQDEQAALIEHHHVGLGTAQRLAGVGPLFDSLVVFENDIDLTGYAGSEFPVASVDTVEAPHYPLTLLVSGGATANLTLRLLYDADRVDSTEAAALVDRTSLVLTSLAADLDAPLDAIDLLRADERASILSPVPGAPVDDSTIADVFARIASEHPDASAVRFTAFGSEHTDQLTYAELDEASNRLARILVEDGVGPETFVAVALPRSTMLVTVLVAVIKAGGAYVPLDTGYPADRLAYIAGDTAPVCVLTSASEKSAVQDAVGDRQILVLDDPGFRSRLAAESAEPVARRAHLAPDNTAYVIYTSGSTGAPKGVLVPHRSVLELLANTSPEFGFGPSDVWTMFHSFAFDFSVWELWGPLLHGASLVVVDHAVTRSPEHFLELLRSERVTVLNQTPSAFYPLIEADREHAGPLSLRYIIFGGEALDLRRLDTWYSTHENAPVLVNMYGITETTVHVSRLELDAERARSASASVVGAAIPGLHMYVLNRRLEPVPQGFAGEIYVSGGQLSRGYHGRTDLTSTRFVANMFDTSGSRLYRTGDVGRWNALGELEFVGRADDQVKIRGFRIELGEIEAAILALDCVRGTAVTVREDTPGRKILVAYVVVNRPVPTADLRAALADSLPEYMVPAAFVTVESLPLTVNGKLDRAALPAPAVDADTAPIAPTSAAASDAEAVLGSLFADILGVGAVGVDDDFFALGGDSIVAITLVNRARKAGIAFTPRDVFTDRTPRALATRAPAETAPAAASVAPVADVGDLVPLPIVHRLRELGGSIDNFTLSLLVQVPGTATADILERAVGSVVDHHDALRIVLSRMAPDDTWALEVRPPGSTDPHSMLSRVAVTEPDWLRSIVEIESAAAAERLDPVAGRMLELVWFDAGPQPGRLLIVAHHLVIDGVSWRILLDDLADAFDAVLAGRPVVLDPVPTSIRRFSRELSAHAQSAAVMATLPTWLETVAGGAELVPTAPEPVRTLADTTDLTVTVDPNVTARILTDVPAEANADVTDVLVAALRVAVSRWQSVDGGSPRELTVDLERHGHDYSDSTDLSRTVGWFTSIAPIRLAATSDPVGALSTTAHASHTDGSSFALLRYLNPQTKPILAQHKSPQVLFNYLGRFAGSSGTDWTEAAETDALRTEVKGDLGTPYVLEINAVLRDGADGSRLQATFTHTADLGADDANHLAQLWTAALADLVDAADAGRLGGLTAPDVSSLDLGPAEVDTISALTSSPVQHLWPLSPLQEGLYFQAHAAGGGDVYTAQNVFTFDRRLDVARLQTAATAVLKRHHAAGSGFTSTLSRTVAFVPKNPSITVGIIDLTDADIESVASALAEVVDVDRAREWVLDEPPLLRITVVRCPDGTDRLLFTYHLLLWDGWSRELILADFLALYEDSDVRLPALTVGFADYLEWLADRDAPAGRAYWATELADLAAPSLVAGNRDASSASAPVRPEAVIRTLTADTSAALTYRTRADGVTLNSVLSAALAVVLAYSTGVDDVVFGTTVSGRPTELDGVDAVVGVFLNTVPVRVRLDPAAPISALARNVQNSRIDAMPYEHVGLGDIVRASGHDQLFDTLFVLQNFLGDDTFTDMNRRHHITGVQATDSTHYPFTWVVTPGAEVTIKLEYRPDVVSARAATALLDRFEKVVSAYTENDTAAISRLSLDLPDESARRAAAIEAVRSPVDTRSVADLLSEQATRTPDRIALVFGERRVTFTEFDTSVSRLAHLLMGRGCGPEQIVALALPRSIESVIALFAVLRAGGAYLPLELDHPDERLTGILADARPALLITTRAVAPRLAGALPIAATLVIDDAEAVQEWRDQPDTAPDDADLGTFARTNPDRLNHMAYVIYTSGSTGKPKGVVTPYRGLTNMQVNHQREIFDPVVESVHERRGDRTLTIAHTVSFSFDMSWEELLWLVEGHEVHICDEELRRDATALVEYCTTHLVDVVNVTPTYAHHLIAEGLLESEHRPALVLLGGEAVTEQVWHRLRDADGVLGYNLYGPTEYTINTLGGGTADSPEPTVGRPILNTYARVLDSWLREVPDGVPGELYIAGAGLGRGYLDRYGVTSERFVADPYASDAERIYRTGDLVRRGADGRFDFLGRTDDQVKIRGYRVEVGEVESAIAAVPGVAHAAVVARPDPAAPGSKRLAAYVLPLGAAPDRFLLDLRESLQSRLPGYMVPALFAVVTELPLTVNGKLDLSALPEPTPIAGVGRAAETDAERAVCAVFADVLDDVGDVGAEDDFFTLGGHSMLAIRLLGRIRSDFGVTLSIRDLFELRTPAHVAERIEQSAGTVPGLALVPRESSEPAPLSSAQERLWLVDRLAGGSSAYTYPLVVHVTGELDVDALRAALSDVADRHEILRSVVDERDGTPVSRVLELGTEAPFEIRDVAEADIDSEIRRVVDRPFDLAREIPLRAGVFRLDLNRAVIALVLHHMATDEWSDRPFLDDLNTAYLARRDGAAPQWEPLPVQYADYAAWHRQVLGDPNDSVSQARTDRDYWTATLAGLPEEISLPVDRPRGAERTAAADSVLVDVPDDVVELLRALASEYQASVFMVLHAAVAALLHRMGAGDDIVLGTPISGRTDVALDDLVGFFVNTLVLRSDLSGDASFADLLTATREVDLAAFDHQELPFQQVVEAVNPDRIAGRNPLFQAVVGYHNRTDAERQVLGLETQWMDGSNAAAKFDLHFSFVDIAAEGASSLVLSLEFASDLFDRATAQQLARRLLQLLAAVAVNPATTVSELPVLLADVDTVPVESDSIVAGDERTLGAVFTEVVSRHADSTAVVDGDRSWTYAELDAAATTLAAVLTERGVQPGDRVAIGLSRSADQIAALLAVVKVGAAYVPLDITYPQARLEYILADSGAVGVITASDVADRLPPNEIPRVLIDELSDDTAAAAPAVTTHPDAVAYVIYTSGSTGQPKGVAVSHRNVLALLAAADERFDLDSTDVWTMFHSFAFDFSVWETWGPLLHGAALVVVDYDTSRSPVQFLELLRREQVTVLSQTPSAFYQLLAADPTGSVVDSLRYTVFGGEALDLRRLRPWFARGARSAELVNMYGITETTVHVSFQTIHADQAASETRSLIGRALPGLTVHVLDRYLRPAPRGVVGEMYVSGDQVASGYLGRGALTSTRFVANPFGTGGSRLYRSGDLARWVDVAGDPVLEYLGRADDQVKLRGFRIELGEIEAAVREHAGVAQATVIVREDRPGEQQLVAYWVPREHGSDYEDIEHAVAQLLPAHLVPNAFVELAALPLTTNGKLDRRALPAPDFGSLVTGSEPTTDTETYLVGLFADVLGLDRLGVDDSFFALGGHSLLAMRILSGIGDRWGVTPPMRVLFDSPTVRTLAAAVESSHAEATPAEASLESIVRPAVLPLSYAQQRMWAMYRVDGATSVYNVPVAWQLDGEVDVAALEQAAVDVVNRHESLRTVFPDVDGEAISTIVPDVTVGSVSTSVVIDAEDLEGYLDEAANYPFELDSEIPVRIHVVSTAPDHHVLLLVVHHIAIDDWSVGPLAADLAAAYAARRNSAALQWEPQAVQYPDYAVWQRHRLETVGSGGDSRTVRDRRFWTETLTDVPVEMVLPFDRPRPDAPTSAGGQAGGRSGSGGQAGGRSGSGGIVTFTLDAGLVSGLRDVARRGDASMFMVAHAVLATVLTKVGAGHDIVLGTPISGRSDPALAPVIGLFLNSIVLRTDTSGDPSFADVLARVRTDDLDAFEHQELPFEKMVEVARQDRASNRHPLFQTMLVYIVADTGAGLDLSDATVTSMPLGTHTSKFDLGVNFVDRGESIDCELEFARDLFDDSTIELLGERLRRVVAAVVEDADAPLSSIDVLGDDERRRILSTFNDTSEAETHHVVPELFAARAVETPDALAVVAGEVTLTYGELSERVGELAQHLLAQGLQPEQVVAVSLPRSADMVVAVLAVMAAGGAFVPLDPSWPDERRAGVAADAGVVFVLASEGGDGAGRPIVTVDLDHWAYAGAASGRSLPSIDGQQLAYVIFTSGSTGKPKGAMIRHEAICARLEWQRTRVLGFGPADASLFKAPLAFDISVNEILLPLVSGGTVVVAEPDGERDALYLLDTIERHDVTFVYLVSSMLGALLELAEGTTKLDGLAHVWCGGEVLTPALFDRFRRQLDTTMYHGYGPAEATIGVSHVIYRSDAARIATSIGKPNPNTELYVLDSRLQPVPIGVVGELYAGGFLLGRGYVNAPGLSATRFVANPYSSGRLYRTGDLARWSADGSLDFMGRADNQVKVRGMRLELEDVEVALSAHPAVRQSAVLARENASGSTYLAGYVRLDASYSPAPSAEDLRLDTARRVPEYMVPSVVVVLDQFPLTANGKVDRRRLPEPEMVSPSESREPRTDAEAVVCAAFAAVLGVDAVGVTDEFFALGGDSILAIRLVSALRKQGLSVGPRQLFELRTPEALARLAESEPSTPGVVEPVPVTDDGPIPLTPALHWMVDDGVRLETFGSPMLLMLPENVDGSALSRTVQAVLDRHEMLRARLIREDPSVVIGPVGSVRAESVLRRVDARDVEGVALDELIRRHAVEANSELDLYTGDLVRMVWFDRGPAAGRLLAVVHHMAVDGMSWRIVSQDLQAAYDSVVSGSEPQLSAPTTSYETWARALIAVVREPRVAADLVHWLDVTEGVPSLRSGRAASRTTARAQSVGDLDAARTAAVLDRGSSALGVGTADVLAAALAVATARWRQRWTDDPEVTVTAMGLQGHGRHEHLVAGADLSRTVGWFADDYPVALDVAGAESDSVVDRVRAALAGLAATPNDGGTFSMLRYLSRGSARVLQQQAEPEIFFNYHGIFGAPESVPWQMDPAYGDVFDDWQSDRLDGVLVSVEARVVPSDAAGRPEAGRDGGRVLTVSVSSRPGGLSAESVEALTSEWLSVLTELSTVTGQKFGKASL